MAKETEDSTIHIVTPENKKLFLHHLNMYRVIVTTGSGRVVLVTKRYQNISAAIKRADKLADSNALPRLYATLLEEQD